MPLKSQRQWKWMFAAERKGELPQGTARRWAHETKTPFKKLPKRVKASLATHGLDALNFTIDDLAYAAVFGKLANLVQTPTQAAKPMTQQPNFASGLMPPPAQPLVPPGPAPQQQPAGLTNPAPQVVQALNPQPAPQPAQPPVKSASLPALLLEQAHHAHLQALLPPHVYARHFGKKANTAPPPQAPAAPPPPPPGSFKPSSLLQTVTTPGSPTTQWLSFVQNLTVPQAPGLSTSQAVASGQQVQNSNQFRKVGLCHTIRPIQQRDILDQLAAKTAAHTAKVAFQVGNPYGFGPGGAQPNYFGGQGLDPVAAQLQHLNRLKALNQYYMASSPQHARYYQQQLQRLQRLEGGLLAVQKADEAWGAQQKARMEAQRAQLSDKFPSPFAQAGGQPQQPTPRGDAKPAENAPVAAPKDDGGARPAGGTPVLTYDEASREWRETSPQQQWQGGWAGSPAGMSRGQGGTRTPYGQPLQPPGQAKPQPAAFSGAARDLPRGTALPAAGRLVGAAKGGDQTGLARDGGGAQAAPGSPVTYYDPQVGTWRATGVPQFWNSGVAGSPAGVAKPLPRSAPQTATQEEPLPSWDPAKMTPRTSQPAAPQPAPAPPQPPPAAAPAPVGTSKPGAGGSGTMTANAPNAGQGPTAFAKK